MRTIIRLITGFGDYLMGLSDRTRLAIVMVGLLLLGAGGIYKLVVSIRKLNEPQPVATPDQLLKPMGKLFAPANDNYGAYQQARRELDSLRQKQRQFNPTSLPR